jgi:hypothetical protein
MKNKKIILEISKANPGQLLSIKSELNLMSKAWRSYGPKIDIKGYKIKEPAVHIKKALTQW